MSRAFRPPAKAVFLILGFSDYQELADCSPCFSRVTLAAQVNRIRQFGALPAADRRLLLRAVALVAAARIALWTLPFRWVRLVAGRGRAVSLELAPLHLEHDVERLVWAVRAAARRIP